MQLQELTYLLQHPEAVTASQTDALLAKIKDYPYFQPLRALYLKGLKQKESYKYNNALKITAAHTADRSVLFDYITSEVFNQNEISNHIKQNSEHLKSIEVNDVDDISVNKSVTIDDALKEHIKATEGILDPNLFEAKQQHISKTETPRVEDSIIDVDVDNITAEEKLNIGKPLEFDKNESHSFTEWLKITNFKPIVRDTETETKIETDRTSEPLANKLGIINKFISENPKIKPVASHTPKPKLVNNDDDTSDSLMTETLARIYLEQKNYDKAIQSYKILSLKYPEKSSFFADQIKLIVELKDNNTI
ncbi:MAG: tetratricopeptide repeat protein [Winogradskyella sp.]